MSEIVMARFENGSTGLRKKSWCQAHGVSYRLLEHQPLTPAEKRAQERDNADTAQRAADRDLVTSLSGAKGWSEQRGIGGARVHLSQKERKSIERMTGVMPDDAQHARRILKDKGMRFMEKGEATEQMIEAQIAYADSEGEKRGAAVPDECQFPGYGPEGYGLMPKIKPFDFRERMAFHEARLRREAEGA